MTTAAKKQKRLRRPKWTTVVVDIDTQLEDYQYNPRIIDPKSKKFKDAVLSFKRFGQALVQPVQPLGDDKYMLIGGHATKQIIKTVLKSKTMEVRVPNRQFTDDEVQHLNIALNHITAGETDFNVLSDHFDLESLINYGADDLVQQLLSDVPTGDDLVKQFDVNVDELLKNSGANDALGKNDNKEAEKKQGDGTVTTDSKNPTGATVGSDSAKGESLNVQKPHPNRHAINEVDFIKFKDLVGYGTSIARTNTSRPVSFFQQLGILKGNVLDYGSGQDIHDYDRFDPFYNDDPIIFKNRYDVVMCNYVLNILPLTNDRRQVVFTMNGLLKDDGFMLVTVKTDTAEDTLSSRGFQSGWSFDEWLEFLRTFCYPEPIERLQAFRIPKF